MQINIVTENLFNKYFFCIYALNIVFQVIEQISKQFGTY